RHGMTRNIPLPGRGGGFPNHAGRASVEGGAGDVAILVVMDRDLLHVAQIDVVPHRVRAIDGVDDFQVPFAGLDLGAEVNVDLVAVGKGAGAENVFLPIVGLARGDVDLLELITGLVD